MSLSELVRLLRRKHILISLGGGALAAFIVILVTVLMPAVYEARVEVRVTDGNQGPVPFATDRTSMVMGVTGSDAVALQVARTRRWSLLEARQSLLATALPERNVIVLSTCDDHPDRAVRTIQEWLTASRDVFRSWKTAVSSEGKVDLGPVVEQWRSDARRSTKLLARISSSDQPGDFTPEELRSAKMEIDQLRLRLQAVESKISSTKARELSAVASGSVNGGEPAFQELSDLISKVRAKQQLLAELRVSFGEQAPEVAREKRELELLVESKERASGSAKLAVELLQTSVLASLVVEREALSTELSARQKILSGSPDSVLILAELQRTLSLQSAVLVNLETKLATLSIDSQSALPEWHALSEPFVMPTPVNKRYVAFGGITFVGASFAVALLILVRLNQKSRGDNGA